MNAPVQTQPPPSDDTVFFVDSYPSPIAPYGPPVILGPIVPSASGPRVVGPQPTFMSCHMCNQEIKTVIFLRPTLRTHFFAACLCILGCWPCMCIPYCMHTCKKTDHYCPYCSAFMGSYSMD